jgi:lipoprotein NlpI
VARELIASRADTLTANDWITPVVRFYAGSIPAEEVIEAAESVDAELRSERICQANYYLGMAYLLGLPDGARPDTSAAMGYFEQCMATGEDSPESRHAGLMLESR